MSQEEGMSVAALIEQAEALCASRGLAAARDVKLGPYLAPLAIGAHDPDGVRRDVVIALEPRAWPPAVSARMGGWAAVERERMLNLNQADFVAILVPGEGEGAGALTTLSDLAAFLDGFQPPRGAAPDVLLRGAPAPTRAYQGELATRLASYTGGGIVFVAMPFAEAFAPVFFDLVAPAVAGAGLVAMRTDQAPTLRAIDERIRAGIRVADLVVADLTTLNANVFYELGVAHALGKQSLLLRQPGTELPFDVRYHEAFDYDAVAPAAAVAALQKRLAAAAADLWRAAP